MSLKKKQKKKNKIPVPKNMMMMMMMKQNDCALYNIKLLYYTNRNSLEKCVLTTSYQCHDTVFQHTFPLQLVAPSVCHC